VLSLPLLLDMPSSTTAGSPSAAYAQFLRRQHRPSPSVEQLGTPKNHHPLPMVSVFAVSPVRSSLRPVELLASLGGSDRVLPSQPRLLLPGFRWVAHPPIAGISMVATGQVFTGGTFTTSASIAAPTPPGHAGSHPAAEKQNGAVAPQARAPAGPFTAFGVCWIPAPMRANLLACS
jgi:hypothetical protein